MSLNTPEQQVVPDDDGGWELAFRAPLPLEGWNAQISLLTGMAAANLMLAGGIGVLRTMPAADPRDVDRLRRVARGLGIGWPPGEGYGELLSRLDARRGRDAAFMTEATRLFRGAAYAAFDGPPPVQATHAAIAAPYAHCTAPLRRLVDRYVGEVCVSLCTGGGAAAVPAWVRAALPALPEEMAMGIHRGNQLERADIDLVEAAVLAPVVGQVFRGVVVDLDERRGGATVQLADPAVLAHCDAPPGQLPLGGAITVRLVKADVATRTVRFVRAS
jgi:exoribonuclease R